MKLKVVSDLHMEFWKGIRDHHKVIPNLYSYHEDTILIIAGDLHVGAAIFRMLNDLKEFYNHIIYVPGNHEYYGCDFDTLNEQYKLFDNDSKIHIMYNQMPRRFIKIDKYVFVGCTLWTDFLHQNPDYILGAIAQLTDLKQIYNNGHVINYHDIIEFHRKDLEFLKFALTVPIHNKPIQEYMVAVTHHAPSMECIHPHFKRSPLNGSFVNDLDHIIKASSISYWIHGHTHRSIDFTLPSWKGRCRVICNPYGYFNKDQNKDFNPNLILNYPIKDIPLGDI